MSAVVRSPETLKEAIAGDLNSGRYLITAMDGETFGHHRPGLEKMLIDIFSSSGLDFIKVSDIKNYYHDVIEIEPVKSTWASSKEDIDKGPIFIRLIRKTPFTHAKECMTWRNRGKNLDKNIRGGNWFVQKMDMASCKIILVGSAKPWWSLEMIEFGERL